MQNQFLYKLLSVFDELLYLPYLQNLQSQMTEFEASAEPLQDWLNSTEARVQESSARLHDLPAKKQELSKLQVFWNTKDILLIQSYLNLLCVGFLHWMIPHSIANAQTTAGYHSVVKIT